MDNQVLRDRLWLWGMKVNSLQAKGEGSGFGESAITAEEVIQRTGIRNVVMAGDLEIDERSLASVPSARRLVCKWALHERGPDGTLVLKVAQCRDRLLAAKRLAAADTRIEGFLVDDLSTGSIDAGITPEHLTKLQFVNAVYPHRLPLGGTLYMHVLERPELLPLLPSLHFLYVPLWHADRIETVPAALARVTDLAGGKPLTLCRYFFDFGNGRPIPPALMQRHLDLAEELLLQQKVTGVLFCGTCMMDLGWASTACFYQWLERVGDRTDFQDDTE